METWAAHDSTTFSVDVNASEAEAEFSNTSVFEGVSSSEDVIQEVENAGELFTRVELDLACTAEKLVNLNILIMHVAMMESDFEAFVSEKEEKLNDSAEKAMVFNLLSGVLDSEVREVSSFISALQADIGNARGIISSCQHLGEVFNIMEDKLLDSEESLKQSLDQVSEVREQSDKFQRILWSLGGQDNGKGDKATEFSENEEFPSLNAKITMQTAEQQRHILRMLEKSLARELDLEKKYAESRQSEDHLKLRLHSSDQEVSCVEEEAALVWERLLESENAAEVFMGTSKELLSRLQIVQFNLNSSNRREEELRSKLHDSNEKLNAKDNALLKLETSLREAEDKLNLANSETFSLREKVSSLEKQLKESESNARDNLDSEIHKMRNVIEDLKEKNSKAENRAESVNSLERQLRETSTQLQHASASAEATLEKQTMLYSTISDMGNLIDDLKLKVVKAENRADSVEDRCIILSESNSDLNEELRFLRGRLQCLEASLQQAEETKKATGRDIGIRTKVITDLVMQLALERDRLHKKISALVKQNKSLVENFQLTKKNVTKKEYSVSMHDSSTATFANESKAEATEFSATSIERDMDQSSASVFDTEAGPEDIASKLDTVRNIDARQLNFKHVHKALLTFLVISAFAAAFLFQRHNNQL